MAKANEELAKIIQRNLDTLIQLDKQAERRLLLIQYENKNHRKRLRFLLCIQVIALIIQALLIWYKA